MKSFVIGQSIKQFIHWECKVLYNYSCWIIPTHGHLKCRNTKILINEKCQKNKFFLSRLEKRVIEKLKNWTFLIEIGKIPTNKIES